jgi:hypothetical protein
MISHLHISVANKQVPESRVIDAAAMKHPNVMWGR